MYEIIIEKPEQTDNMEIENFV